MAVRMVRRDKGAEPGEGGWVVAPGDLYLAGDRGAEDGVPREVELGRREGGGGGRGGGGGLGDPAVVLVRDPAGRGKAGQRGAVVMVEVELVREGEEVERGGGSGRGGRGGPDGPGMRWGEGEWVRQE